LIRVCNTRWSVFYNNGVKIILTGRELRICLRPIGAYAPEGIVQVRFDVVRPEKAILPFKALFIDLFKCFKIYPVKCRFAALLWRI